MFFNHISGAKLNTAPQLDLDVIDKLSEQILVLAEKLEFIKLEKMVPEYSRLIEQQFQALDKSKLTELDMINLKKLLVRHKELVQFLSDKKKKITDDLKQLHLGQEMQQAYPKNIKNF